MLTLPAAKTIPSQSLVTACDYSPDGSTFLTCSSNSPLTLWNVQTGAVVRRFNHPHIYMDACAYSADGTQVMAVARDGVLRLWNIDAPAPIKQIKNAHTVSIRRAAYSPNGQQIALGSVEGDYLSLFAIETEQFITLRHNIIMSSIWDCTYSPDGRWLATAHEDHTVRLWDVVNAQYIGMFQGHTARVQRCVFSPDGKNLLSASKDKTVKIWDLLSRTCIKTLVGHIEAVWDCAISPNGLCAISASNDRSIKLWGINSGVCLATFIEHAQPVVSCAFSPQGKQIISAARDEIKLWDLLPVLTAAYQAAPVPVVMSLDLLPERRFADLSIRLRDPEEVNDCNHMSTISPDGRWAVIFSGGIRLKSLQEGIPSRALKNHIDMGDHTITSCAFSSNGEWLVAGNEVGVLQLWNLLNDQADNIAISVFKVNSWKKIDIRHIKACAFSSDNRYILSASLDKTVKLWDIQQQKCIKEYEYEYEDYKLFHFVMFIDATRFLVSAHGSILMRDIKTGNVLKTFKPLPASRLRDCKISQDCRYMLLASGNNLSWWDIETGQLLKTLSMHTDSVNSCAIFPDGRYALSASDDKTLRIWDLQNGVSVKELTFGSFAWGFCAILHDGVKILLKNNLQKVYQWDLSAYFAPRTEIELARARRADEVRRAEEALRVEEVRRAERATRLAEEATRREEQAQARRADAAISAQPIVAQSINSNTMLNSSADIPNPCVICMEAVKNITCVPCGHMCMCQDCSDRLKNGTNECPICRKYIDIHLKTFI